MANNNALAPVMPTALAPSHPERLTLEHVVELTGYTLAEIALVRSTVAKDAATLQDLALFLHGAKRLGLDPLARQIYWIVRKGKGGIQVGIDGFRLVAARSNAYAGSEAPIFRGVKTVMDGTRKLDVPEKATVVVWRMVQGHKCAFTGEARWDEFYPGDGDVAFMWRKMPHGQLGKCAEAQALRKGFPAEMTGMPAAPEADDDTGRMTVTEVQPAPRAAMTAADYTRIHGSDDEGTAYADQPAQPTGPARASESPPRDSGARGPDDDEMVTSRKDARWAAWSAAVAQADAEGIAAAPYTLPINASVLEASVDTLRELVDAKRAEAAPA